MGKENLEKAKENKKDEFYTQLCDIEKELISYKDKFKNKIIYCNCDNPKLSNFYKYFKDNFKSLELKGLIATYYDKTKEVYKTTYNGVEETKEKLEGNGDFRSNECIEILKKVDYVITNPPFSLFREFVSQLLKYEKKFLIIGNINCITYKEIFNEIKDNRIWLGTGLGRWISGFIVPKDYELYGTEAKVNDKGERIVATNNCLWLTNIDHGKRHDILELMTMEENLTKNKALINKLKKNYNSKTYPKYDNYDAIEVPFTEAIPSDYKGAMGVPITFLTKYNPDQFEIIKFRKGNDDKDLCIDKKSPYFRILIKFKNTDKKDI